MWVLGNSESWDDVLFMAWHRLLDLFFLVCFPWFITAPLLVGVLPLSWQMPPLRGSGDRRHVKRNE